MSRNKITTFVVILLLAGLAGGYWLYSRPKTPQTNPTQAAVSSQQAEAAAKTIRLIATGDVIPSDTLNNLAKQQDGSYEYSPMMQNMKPFFDRADIRFCNQAVLAGGSQFGISGYPVFNAPTEFVRDLGELGCNLVNAASNHTSDKSQAVINATLDAWEGVPNLLAIAGADRSATEQQQIRYFSSKGVKFAFLAYSTYTNTPPLSSYGVNMFSRQKASAQLSEARKQADIVLVSMRWGTEYSSGVNAFQTETAQFLADNGADVILGHGPHFLEPVDWLTGLNGRKTLVWYSLGNFINTQLEIESLFPGIAVMDIDIASKTVTKVSFLPIYMHYEWTSEEKAREDLLKRTNAMMYGLDNAAEPLKKSQNNTTVETERARITSLLNTFTEVTILHDSDY